MDNQIMNNQIKFYGHKRGPYRCFSNFYEAAIAIDYREWPTSEHYFQAMKFPKNLEYQEKIRCAATPYEAKSLGRTKEIPIDKNWNGNCELVMFDACFAKFSQHKDLQQILLSTGDAIIIEDSPHDYIWGCGKNGTGRNLLGIILMKIRDQI